MTCSRFVNVGRMHRKPNSVLLEEVYCVWRQRSRLEADEECGGMYGVNGECRARGGQKECSVV